MDKGKFYAGLFIMAGLVFMGCMLPRIATEFRSYERYVSVKGLCEKEVKADKVIWPLKHSVFGNDLGRVYAELEQKDAMIRAFLIEGGIQPDEISVSATELSDKFAQTYQNERDYRFVASSTTTVCTHDVDKVLRLMEKQSQLIKENIVLSGNNDWEARIQFDFEGLNDIKPEMIEEATKNAREVALKFASDSDSRLGKIKDASQGTFSIEDRDSNTPYIKRVRIVTYVSYYLKK